MENPSSRSSTTHPHLREIHVSFLVLLHFLHRRDLPPVVPEEDDGVVRTWLPQVDVQSRSKSRLNKGVSLPISPRLILLLGIVYVFVSTSIVLHFHFIFIKRIYKNVYTLSANMWTCHDPTLPPRLPSFVWVPGNLILTPSELSLSVPCFRTLSSSTSGPSSGRVGTDPGPISLVEMWVWG